MRRRVLMLCGAAVAAGVVPARAQMHHVDAPEQTTRAVGVYEWTGELDKPKAMRLVPVSLFLQGSIHNAGTYMARPVPFALETGNVYEVDFAGVPKGLVDVKMARDAALGDGPGVVANDNPDGSWYGYGPFAKPGAGKPSKLKTSATPVKVEASGDDDRPHFVEARPETADAAPASGKSTATDEDTERPTLRHRDDDTADANGKKAKKDNKPQSYVTGMSNGLNDDPDRPTLKRGGGATEDTPPLEGLPADMHQAVAVSDPRVSADPHEFARTWENSAERDAVMAEVRKIADPMVQKYMSDNGLVAGASVAAGAPAAESDSSGAPKLVRTPGGVATGTAATPAQAPANVVPTPARKNYAKRVGKVSATAPAPLVYAQQDLHGYELSYGGLPTFVYTASLPVTVLKATTATASVSVAMVAQRLPTGELQVSLQSVTDSGHLNRTPWMRFVDVVDADGSHRASLLFELRAAHARQFALYRLTSATAEQMFVTDPML